MTLIKERHNYVERQNVAAKIHEISLLARSSAGMKDPTN
jgi:hypothetical protein